MHIGEDAGKLVARGGRASVIGSTSKGIFALTQEKNVLFLSYESYRSPITIAMGNVDDDLRKVEIGSDVQFESGKLIFTDQDIIVDASTIDHWKTNEPLGEALPVANRREMVLRVARRIVEAKPDIGFSPLVSSYILGGGLTNSGGELEGASGKIREIFRGASKRDLFAVLLSIEGLLGFGRGLTPSGDDFAMGFLLAINRWKKDLNWQEEAVGMFNESLVRMAQQKTTSLSAALIRQAALGRGDERQIAVVDGLVSGEPPENVCLKYSLEMGNSSGIDSFLGMAAGVL